MNRADEVTPGSESEATALRFFTTLMIRDMEGFSEIWHEDAVLHILFKPDELGVPFPDALRGKAEIVDQYSINVKNRRDHVFWIDHLHATIDPNCVIVEAHARSIVGETNGVYEQSYVFVFNMKDGLVIEVREYANPINVAKALRKVFES